MLRSAILFFSLLTLPVHANLGETVAQCVARYGRPVGFSEANAKFPFGTVAFSATGYTLIVFLIKDKEVGARVSKQDKSAFSDAERQNIMAADSDGTPWVTTTSDDPTCLRWIRGDQATVLYDKANHVLIFTSKEMADAVHPAPAQAPLPAPPKPAAN
jgi:hypothetical protein